MCGFNDAVFHRRDVLARNRTTDNLVFHHHARAFDAGVNLDFGVTVLVAQGDQSVRNEVQKHPGDLNSIPIQAGYYWGVGYPTAILALGFGLHGWLDDNNSTKKIKTGILAVKHSICENSLYLFLIKPKML